MNRPYEQSRPLLCSLALSALALGACARSGGPPVVASSASQPAYAITYTDDLAADSKSITDGTAAEKQTAAGFGAHVDELKKIDWAKVEKIVEQADASGKSAAYADAHGESTAVGDFWNAERDTIDAKVGGNAQYAAKQASCTADVSGAATFALNDTFDKEVRKRLRSRNDAYVTIERNRTAFGPANAAALEKLADDVAETSFQVYIALPRDRERLRARLDDKSGVDKTLGRYVEDEKAFQAEPGANRRREEGVERSHHGGVEDAGRARRLGAERQGAARRNGRADRRGPERLRSGAGSVKQKISDKQKGG